MYTHIVFFKLKEATKENLEYVKNVFLDMDGNIEVLKSVEVGIDDVRSARSYDISLLTRFDSKEDYLKYDKSDYHVNQVIPALKGYLEKSKSVDY